MKRMRNPMILALFSCIVLISQQSCTAIRDTTPCNSTQYLKLQEKPDPTTEERAMLDTFANRCSEYTRQQEIREASGIEEDHEGAGWLGVGLGVAAALIILYFSGLVI